MRKEVKEHSIEEDEGFKKILVHFIEVYPFGMSKLWWFEQKRHKKCTDDKYLQEELNINKSKYSCSFSSSRMVSRFSRFLIYMLILIVFYSLVVLWLYVYHIYQGWDNHINGTQYSTRYTVLKLSSRSHRIKPSD